MLLLLLHTTAAAATGVLYVCVNVSFVQRFF